MSLQAAGVVRHLVSTVIKGDNQGMLEASLQRCDYRNSEMPQAFRYSVICGAYEKVSLSATRLVPWLKIFQYVCELISLFNIRSPISNCAILTIL